MADENVRQKSEEAALCAIERVMRMLRDDETSVSDALKAAALVFDKIYQKDDGQDAAFDIRVE